MGSPVTFSGFTSIDWNSVLNAVMAQESQPVAVLQSQQSTLKSQQSAFSTLATKLTALETASNRLSSTTTGVGGRSGSSTDSNAVQISAGPSASVGIYDVVVSQLARAQVTASTSLHPDADTTAVASGGSLVINGKTVTVTVPTTLQKLADAINATDDIGVTATVVSPTPGQYQLVLTSHSTGAANGFTIQNNLTGGASAVTFADTDGDGLSGNSAADNKVSATDAVATINNVQVSSPTNTIDSAIYGASITLLKKDPAATVTLSVTEDLSAGKQQIKDFVSAFNDLLSFASDQSSAALKGQAGNIGRDALLRGLRSQLRSNLSSQYATGGKFSYLSQVGLGFDRSGKLTFDESVYDAAVKGGTDAVQKLFSGAGGVTGAFATLKTSIAAYTQAGGLLPNAKDRIDAQLQNIGSRIDEMNARLDLRRAALQKEYQATDSIISSLNNSVNSLSTLGNQYRLF